jgi:hypothetical protein
MEPLGIIRMTQHGLRSGLFVRCIGLWDCNLTLLGPRPSLGAPPNPDRLQSVHSPKRAATRMPAAIRWLHRCAKAGCGGH